MTTSILDKDTRTLVRKFGHLLVAKTKRHIRITNPQTGGFVIAPTSGSDWRGLKNLERDLRHLCAGIGYGQRVLHA